MGLPFMSRPGGRSPRGWALRRETGKGAGTRGHSGGLVSPPLAGCCPGDRAGLLVESLGWVGVSSQEKAAAPAPPPDVSGSVAGNVWLWTAVQPVVPWAQVGYGMGS